MIYYIETREVDPYRNLALEQFVFDNFGKEGNCFMLWQNHNSIIVGKNQNTQEEINSSFVTEKNITVARRLSGGGAVYHDLGNLNFTFISAVDKTAGIDFAAFCEPICQALRSMGVPVEISGRNDMTVEGKKFSGNAQYVKQGRVMHHGTILYDSDMSVLSQALKPGKDKIESKGIRSVQSRVTNIKPYMKTGMAITDFWALLKERIGTALDLRDRVLTPEQNRVVDELRDNHYAKWSWNYGKSPPHNIRRERRIEGCGKIETLLDIEMEGKIKNIAFYGDFFGMGDVSELAAALSGLHFEPAEIKAAIAGMDISRYFHALDEKAFLSLLFD